jgi:hypothetical protein
MKKALAGPAKPAVKKKPERRAMIAAARRRIDLALWWATNRTRRADRAANRRIERASPAVVRLARRLRKTVAGWAVRVGRRLRPAFLLFFRGLAAGERKLRWGGAAAARAATRGSAVVTPQRAICAVVVAGAVCLVASQFIDYRGVEIGQPGYAGLPTIATPPTVDVETAGAAHSYLLVPLALVAAVLGVAAVRRKRRRLGRVVFALGLASLAVVLLVDLPNGLDAGVQASRFSGATAVLYDGFYAELAASVGLALGGLALSLNRQPVRGRSRRPRRTRRRRRTRGRTVSPVESRT